MKTHPPAALDRRLENFLMELTESMGRTERRHWAGMYVRGLLMDGERKSIEPMAQRLGHADVQSLRQFVGQSPWEVEEVQRRLALRMAETLSGPDVWILDETSFPKAGKHSVGVTRQYCGALGKVANCQVAVSLHWAGAESSCPISWRLYLPKEWINDSKRSQEVKLPADVIYRTKTELALELLDQALEWELPSLPVVADSFYGDSFDFRAALRQRGLSYAVAVESHTVVWTQDPNSLSLPKPNGKGRPRRFPPLEAMPKPQNLQEVVTGLPSSAWQTLTWRAGSKKPQRSRFAKLKVWAAHGWRKGEHPPRVAEWLLIEWPQGTDAPTDYWLAQLGDHPLGLRRLVRTAKARWRIEQDYRELKEELGLDHYEGRQWLGWHHHVTLVSMAFAFLRYEQARSKKNFWCDVAPDEETSPAHADSPDRPAPVV